MGERGPEYVGFLEDQVYRLNAELARYQHRGVAGASQLPPDTKNPPDSVPLFLVDSRNLTPLIRAYDDQLDQSKTENATLKLQLQQLSDEVQRLLTHNDAYAAEVAELRAMTDENELGDMREHVAILMEENRILLHREKSAIDQLRDTTSAVQHSSADINESKHKASKLQAENNRLIYDLIELRKLLATVQRERDTAEHEAKEARRSLGAEQGKVAGLTLRLEQQTEMLGTIPPPAPAPATAEPHQQSFSYDTGGSQKPPAQQRSQWHGHDDGNTAVLHELTTRYKTLETEHQLAVTTVAELERQLTASERQRKKLKKMLASVVESSSASERAASQNDHELRALRSQTRKKDKALQSLIVQLNQAKLEAESTKRGATAMVAEATRLVEERRARRHR